MRCIIALVLLLPLVVRAVEWPFIGAEVETNGYILRLKLSTSPDLTVLPAVTNLGFFNGLGTNNSLTSTTALILSITSPGFNVSGVSNLVGRTVYETRLLRLPFGLQNTNDVIAEDVTNVVLRLVLSDYIYAGESFTVSARAGAVASTNLSAFTNSASFTSQVVTNSSTNTYQPVIGNWTWPAHELATGATYRVRAQAYHWSGRERKPVACMEFRASDGNTTLTQVVAYPSIDRSTVEPSLIQDYLWDIPLASFRSSNQVVVNFRAYPWVGLTNDVLDTGDGLYSRPLSGHCPFHFINNTSNEIKRTVAIVSPTGDDGAGIATNAVGWTTNWPAFRTIRGAAAAIAGTNNALYGRNFCDGFVKLEEGTYTWAGTNTAIGDRGSNYLTVTRMPHASRAATIIDTNWGTTSGQNLDCGDFVKMNDVTIGLGSVGGSSSVMWNAIDHLWIDSCTINTFQGAAFHFNTNIYFTRNLALRIRQGFKKTAGAPGPPSLIRGNWLEMTNTLGGATCGIYTGNIRTNCAGVVFAPANEDASDGPRPSTIFSFNRLVVTNLNEAPNTFTRIIVSNNWRGVAIIGNLMETPTSQNGNDDFGANSTSSNMVNFVAYGNTWLSKVNAFYNDAGSVPYNKTLIWNLSSIYADWNMKTDTFTTGDGGRIGNWGPNFGVGFNACIMPEFFDIGTAGSFHNEFTGLNAISPTDTTTNTWARFTDYRAYVDANTAGNGDYRLKSDSPLFKIKTPSPMLPFDLNGHSRGAVDPAGAYVSGNSKKGAFF